MLASSNLSGSQLLKRYNNFNCFFFAALKVYHKFVEITRISGLPVFEEKTKLVSTLRLEPQP